MAAFNAELASKALEKRLAGLESAIDAIQKQSRAAGDSVGSVLALQKLAAEQKQRIDVLEKYVKALMETRGESKQGAMEKLAETIKVIQQQQERDRAQILRDQGKEQALQRSLGMKDVLRKPDVDILLAEQARKLRDDLERVYRADWARMRAEAERAAEAKEKALREQVLKDAREHAAKTMADAAKLAVDVQLKLLNARLQAVEARGR